MFIRTKLFLFFSSLIIAVVIHSIIYVNARFKGSIIRQTAEEMSQVHYRFDQFLGTRMENLIIQTINISADARLRGSLSTGDRRTVAQAAGETAQIFKADIFQILNDEGVLIVDAADSASHGQNLSHYSVVRDALGGYDSGEIWVRPDGLFIVAATPIQIGVSPRGVLITGMRFAGAVSDQFAELTGLDVVLFENGRILVATLDNQAQLDLALKLDKLTDQELSDTVTTVSVPLGAVYDPQMSSKVLQLNLTGRPFAAAFCRLTDNTGGKLANMLVLKSLLPEYQLQRHIRNALVGEGIGAIIVSILIAYFLSRSLTQPINRLVLESIRLGAGELQTPIHLITKGEIGVLAQAFDNMRLSLLQARKELIHNERLSTIGRMASSIIHDFRQPISSLYGYLDLMSMPGLPDTVRDEYKENIYKQIDRMLGMINELLDFARGEVKLNLKPVQLGKFLLDIRDQFERECRTLNISFDIQLGWDGELLLDAGRLQRGIENMIRNAIQAMVSDGRIALTTDERDGEVVIRIRDSGPGVPLEIQDRLFDSFVTHGKAGGTGLGLAVAKKVITEHGGNIALVESSPKGTMFEIYLPKNLNGELG